MIERHVPSLDTCPRLKEAGFIQETTYYWWRHGETDYTLITHKELQTYRLLRWVQDWYAAPILTEILDQLPAMDDSNDHLRLIKASGGYAIGYWQDTEHENAAEAAALLWLKLKEADEE